MIVHSSACLEDPTQHQIVSKTLAVMAGLLDLLEPFADDYHYFFGEAIDLLIEEQNWNFETLHPWDSTDPDIQALVDAYLAYLTDEPGAQALSEEDEETAIDAQRIEWRLYKVDVEIVWSYDTKEIIRASEHFPDEIMDFLKKHAPAFNDEEAV